MNEDIPPPGKGVACRLQAEGVILCLKQPSLVPLIKEPNPFDDVAASCRTEHGNDTNGSLFSLVIDALLMSKPGESLGISVSNFHHCFRVGPVRAWTDQTNVGIGKVIGETGQPARRNYRVVVEKDEYLALSYRQSPVCP